MTTHRLTTKGLQLNVSICGQGSPLLLLNGLGGLIRTFDPLRNELDDFMTITLDVPGVGKSQMPRWPFRLPRHADVIAGMLEQLGIDQVDVFGVSWGGALAQEFALRYPSKVRRLILAATSPGPLLLMKPADVMDFFRKSKNTKTHQQERSGNSVQTLLRFGVMKGMLSVNPRTYYFQLAALIGWTSLLRLSRLLQRTLILAGDRDPLIQAYNGHILRRTIGRSELRLLKGEGHFFVVTSAGRTAVLVREFLCRHYDEEEKAPRIANRNTKAGLERTRSSHQ
ncbi:alpha/beta fold hydrolase [Pseudomonas fluorescens]|uniref:alpha/beta fold hydrolase n=1 Tax=Pseudomonas fluorescens TaxID=294 RepID=UPI0013989B16|nr:alpha/beta hydrolase [Pseudomonas fluorescens]QIA03488.1 alpha/beta fold hydrolase [Pseudomonas fluorescens]